MVVTTGTFLQAIMHSGESQTAGGRAGGGWITATSDAERAAARGRWDDGFARAAFGRGGLDAW